MTAVQADLKIECLDIIDQLVKLNKSNSNTKKHIVISLQSILNEYFNNFDEKI